MSERFSTEQVSKMTGATERQLQYWDELGILVPEKVRGNGRGHWIRNYTKAHIKKIERLVALRKAGQFHFDGRVGKAVREHRGPVRFVRREPILVGRTLVVPMRGKGW